MDAKAIKATLISAISSVTNDISQYVVHPGKDLQRNSKLSSNVLMSFLISEGSSTTRVELMDFFKFQSNTVSASALIQQRNKLKPEALQQVLYNFNTMTTSVNEKYRFIAADGSTATYFSTPRYSSPEYFVDPGHSMKGVYSMHINAFQDIRSHMYTDILIQPVHKKDEFSAFATIVDRHPVIGSSKNVYIGDRGYCSYNNMAHVIQAGQYFLFRAKDVTSKGILKGFGIKADECCDKWVKVILTRTHDKNVLNTPECRFVCANIAFDYIEIGSMETYTLNFRIVRFKLSDESYECIVTNLPDDEFTDERLKELYNERWAIETSFRKLKYTIGLSNFHSYKPEFIMQEIYASVIMYNVTEFTISQTVIRQGKKHTYKANFTTASHVCRIFFRYTTDNGSIDVMGVIGHELIPIRDERKYPRLQTAHFRRPKYFIYRAA